MSEKTGYLKIRWQKSGVMTSEKIGPLKEADAQSLVKTIKDGLKRVGAYSIGDQGIFKGWSFEAKESDAGAPKGE